MATRTGIFGGSFNPPHIAHLIIAETIRDQFELDRVIWIPNYSPPHKPSVDIAEAHHRYTMTQLAIKGHDAFTISPIEIDRKGISYTLDTLKSLKRSATSAELYLMIGGDSLYDFMKWNRPLEIVELSPLIVYHRDAQRSSPSAIETHYPGRIFHASGQLLHISSTSIRQKIKEGSSIRYLVPEQIRSYIHKNKLYL